MNEVLVIDTSTKENRELAFSLAMTTYVGETCRFCRHVFESVEDITARRAVWSGYWYPSPGQFGGRISCEACWMALSEEERASLKKEWECERDRAKP